MGGLDDVDVASLIRFADAWESTSPEVKSAVRQLIQDRDSIIDPSLLQRVWQSFHRFGVRSLNILLWRASGDIIPEEDMFLSSKLIVDLVSRIDSWE